MSEEREFYHKTGNLQISASRAMTEAVNVPMPASPEELEAVQAYDPQIHAFKPFGTSLLMPGGRDGWRRLPPELAERALFSTDFAGTGEVGKAFRAAEHRMVQAGLNILFDPALCAAIGDAVCTPLGPSHPPYKQVGNKYAPFYTLCAGLSLFRDTCLRSPALGLMAVWSSFYLSQLQSGYTQIASQWKQSTCPHLKHVGDRVKNDIVRSMDLTNMGAAMITAPVITIGQFSLQGTADDLLLCTPALMRWNVNRFIRNRLFEHPHTDHDMNQKFRIQCPARDFVRSLVVGQTYEGHALGPGVPGIAQWLHSQRNEGWFQKACADLSADFQDFTYFGLRLLEGADLDKEWENERKEFGHGQYRRVRGEAKVVPA